MYDRQPPNDDDAHPQASPRMDRVREDEAGDSVPVTYSHQPVGQSEIDPIPVPRSETTDHSRSDNVTAAAGNSVDLALAEGDDPSWDRSPAAAMNRITWLIENFHEAVYRFAYRLSGSAYDAEDLTQQTFLIAQEKSAQLKSRDHARGWLLTICRNRFLKDRRRPQVVTMSTAEMTVEEIPESLADDLELDEEKLQIALNALPDEFRIVVLMFYFEQLSYRDIAEQLDLRIGTVMSRLSRAKGRIRQMLVAGSDEDGGSS